MKDGHEILVSEMSDQHILNSIAMLKRIAKNSYDSEVTACMIIGFNGEAAQMAQDQFLDAADWTDYLPGVYDYLCDELVARGIQVPDLG